jgi:Flp pilus assembly protein CpaB
MQGRPNPTAPPGGYPVVVASHDLSTGTVITGTVAVTRAFAIVGRTSIPAAGTFSSLDELVAYVDAAGGGRYLLRSLPAGMPAHRSDLGDLAGRAQPSLSLNLPSGFEAESVSVPSLQSADGAVVAGDQVDVLLTLSTDQLADFHTSDQIPGPQETQQILQDVTVVRADPPIYTLLLRPQDALLLKYVKDSQNATLELALRSGRDAHARLRPTWPILPDYFTHYVTSRFVQPTPSLATPTATGRVSHR